MEDIGGLQEYLDGLPELERQIRHQGFICLLQGKTCGLETLQDHLGVSEDELRILLTTMIQRGTLVWDWEHDTLMATGGLSLVPTAHELALGERKLFAWCAADAVGIPAALNLDADIASSCHTCDQPVTIELIQGKVVFFDPIGVCVWVVSGDPSQSVSGHT